MKLAGINSNPKEIHEYKQGEFNKLYCYGEICHNFRYVNCIHILNSLQSSQKKKHFALTCNA